MGFFAWSVLSMEYRKLGRTDLNVSALCLGTMTWGEQNTQDDAFAQIKLAKAAGINPRDLRYVALEGGGEIATALLGGHIQVGSTDISDSMPHIQSGNMRILAVFSENRLDEPEMKNIPTAKEQGYDIVWPVVRGFYLGPKVSDEDYAWWKASFDKMLASEDFAKLRDQRELFPFAMTGEELDGYVKKQVADYKALAREFGLIQ
jgi:putative tricarboxylic transport membrane protein